MKGLHMKAIDPTEAFAIVELERIRWFLGNLDLTKDEEAGSFIQDAYGAISTAIAHLRVREKNK